MAIRLEVKTSGVVALLILFSYNTFANASCESAAAKVVQNWNKIAANAPLEKAMRCDAEFRGSLKTRMQCMKDNIKGFFADGAWGSLKGLGSIAKAGVGEGLRLSMSTLPLTRMVMTQQSIPTTDELTKAFVEKNGPKLIELAKVAYRFQTDPVFAAEVSLAAANVFLSLMSEKSEWFTAASCDEILTVLCRATGEIGYDVSLLVLLYVLSSETGGTAGHLRAAQVLEKLKTSTKVEAALEEAIETTQKALRAPKAQVREGFVPHHGITQQRWIQELGLPEKGIGLKVRPQSIGPKGNLAKVVEWELDFSKTEMSFLERQEQIRKAARMAHNSPEARLQSYGQSWGSSDLQSALEKFVGPDPKMIVTTGGKVKYVNPITGVEVIEDVLGGYFRIMDPRLPGSRVYLDSTGHLPTEEILTQQGRKAVPVTGKDDYLKRTHFWILQPAGI